MNYTEESPKPLATEFVRDGMTHTQISRIGNVAMFRVGKTPHAAGIEVAIIRVKKPSRFQGREIAGWREVYPQTSEFGVYGWYYQGGDGALDKYHTLANVAAHPKPRKAAK
jgi:hypothetical protein